ncbi:MAG TPA: prolyl oligopeptidase family serine peptidase [Candidatus Thermoplasmatota archaeon]|nr:prolyl oligopeptidase family serine peptidase [Candidatus Thermoplasmatota archaeon]
MERPFAVLALVALLAGCTGGAGADVARPGGPHRVEPFEIEVAGGSARGLVAIPEGTPTTLVVLAHPWSTGSELFRPDLERLAGTGVLGVAMDFRGEVDSFKVGAGVADTVAATLALQADHPSVDRTLLYGWSMGAEVAFLAVADAPAGTYDYVFDGAGVTDLAALWHSFYAARPFIEAETGGTPAEVPAEYARRSPVERVAELKDKGVARYFIVHGAGDAPVPVEQAERMYSGLAEAGLPVSYYVVTTNEEPWLCTPVVTVCAPNPPKGLANHEAGGPRLMRPFLDHRIERLPDPAAAAVRGTYEGDTGTYEPSDVG